MSVLTFCIANNLFLQYLAIGYPPDAPTEIMIVADARTASINYNKITYYGGYSLGSVTFYARYRVNNGDVPNSDCHSCYQRSYGTESSVQLTALLVGTAYYVQIVAFNEAGQNASQWKTFTTRGRSVLYRSLVIAA